MDTELIEIRSCSTSSTYRPLWSPRRTPDSEAATVSPAGAVDRSIGDGSFEHPAATVTATSTANTRLTNITACSASSSPRETDVGRSVAAARGRRRTDTGRRGPPSHMRPYRPRSAAPVDLVRSQDSRASCCFPPSSLLSTRGFFRGGAGMVWVNPRRGPRARREPTAVLDLWIAVG